MVTKTKILVEKSNRAKHESNIIYGFLCLALAIFISYASSISAFLLFSINKETLELTLQSFILILIILFFILLNNLKKKIHLKKNVSIAYLLFSIVLILGVIITFQQSSPYIDKYLSISSMKEFSENYDLIAKNIVIVYLIMSLTLGMVILFIYHVYTCHKKESKFLKCIIYGLKGVLKFLFYITIIYILASIISLFLGIGLNLSFGG